MSLPLFSVSLLGIQTGDPLEAQKLLEACMTDGSFYLTLDRQDPLLTLAEDMFRMANDIFSLPLHEKMKWEMDRWGDSQIGGYKPLGKHTGVRIGGKDGFENFLVRGPPGVHDFMASTPKLFRSSSLTWESAPPLQGSIFVNVGDSLRFLSGGKLASALHRVVPLEITEDRYSIAFFQRPELTAKFIDVEGHQWTSENWHRTKYRVFRVSNEEQKQSSLLTGKKGFLGGLVD